MIELLVSSLALFIAFAEDDYTRNLIFVFGSIGIWCFSLMLKRQRSYRSLPLALFLIWSLICIFLRSNVISQDSVIFYYLNVYLLTEGFVYILAGALLLKTIIDFTVEPRVYYIVAGVAALPWIGSMLSYGRVSVVAGIAVAAIIYGLINKRHNISCWTAVMGLSFAAIKWNFITWKFYPRTVVWREMIDRITLTPIIGTGFNDTVNNGNLIWANVHKYGYLLKHNDYLHVGMALGIVGMILILWFTIQSMWQIRRKMSSILPMGIAIAAFFQCTMFDAHKASIFIILLAAAMLSARKDKLCQLL